MSEVLEFEVFSGGEIVFDLSLCKDCEVKACVEICNSQSGGNVLSLSEGLPSLQKSRGSIKKGGCIECLGCELECLKRGLNAIKINLPIKCFEDYLVELKKTGLKPIYQLNDHNS